MRLVDADSLKNTLEYGLLCNIPDDIEESESEKLNTWIQDAIDKEPTVAPQEPVIDKIRAEIEQLPIVECTETCRVYINVEDFKESVFAIFNKYKDKTESEG